MTYATYPAARAVARRVQPHLEHHFAVNNPDEDTIEAMVDAAFWASLRREEGYIPTISLAFLPPDSAERPLRFEQSLPMAPEALTKLAPAVERPGIHLGVWRYGGALWVWGATRTIPKYCFVVEVIAPGLLVLKHSRGEDSGKYINIAVLESDRIKILNQDPATLSDCPALVTSLLGFESPASLAESATVLTQLAVSMRAHKRGGSLLVVPHASDEWRASIVQPVRYAVAPAFAELADLMKEDSGVSGKRRWQESVRRAVDAVGGLTAVDGATVIADTYEVLAFGAKIRRRSGWPQIEKVLVTEPVEGAEPAVVHPSEVGGTRHLSAAQFAQDQRAAIALVASQDGRFTIFAWSGCEDVVHAHRVESLLL